MRPRRSRLNRYRHHRAKGLMFEPYAVIVVLRTAEQK